MTMRRKRAGRGKAESVELLTLGSLAGNILQAINNQHLAQRERQLAQYAVQLRARCQSAAAEYAVLRQHYEALWQHLQRLSTENNRLRQRNGELELQHVRDENEIRLLRTQLLSAGGAKP